MMVSQSAKRVETDRIVCLNRREFSETSLIVTVFGQKTGKIGLMAKGARRPKSAVAIDQLDIGQATFLVNPEGLGILEQFSQDRVYPALRRSLPMFYAANYLSDLINLATKELDAAPELFELILQDIDRISNVRSADDLTVLIVEMTRQILRWAGYAPQLEHCVNCQRRVGPTEVLFFSASQGGVVCRDCEPTQQEKTRLANRAWYYLRGQVNDTASARQAFDILLYLMQGQMHRQPRTLPSITALLDRPRGGQGQTDTKM